METDSRKQILSLSSHPRRSRRETPGWKDDGELSGSQPGCGFTEGRHEVPVALIEFPADLPTRSRPEPSCYQSVFCREGGTRSGNRSARELVLLGGAG